MDKPSIGSHVVIANSNNALANTAPHGAPSYPPDLICLFSLYNSTSSLSILVLYISAIVRLSRFLPLPSPSEEREREETSIHRYFSNLIHQLVNQSYRMVSRCCSHCGSNGHNSRTCLPAVADDSSALRGGGCISGEIMLFGVRVKVDPMRKSVSMNNLSQYEQPQDLSNNAAASAGATGYASADDAAHHQSNASRERKRGVPWTEEEHKLFLLGLQKVGKGDWRGISRNFVKTRTPTQVASHAQKYFLRRSNLDRRRRRSSLFDITTDSVTAIPVEEELVHQDNLIQHVTQSPEIPNIGGFPVVPFPVSVGSFVFPLQIENPSENLTYGNADQVNNASLVLLRPIPVVSMPNPPPTRAVVSSSQKLTIEDSTLSLKLSLSSDHQKQLSSRHSVFQVMPNFSNRDDMISVA